MLYKDTKTAFVYAVFFLYTGLKPTFILHINRHRKFRCLFSVCQR